MLVLLLFLTFRYSPIPHHHATLFVPRTLHKLFFSNASGNIQSFQLKTVAYAKCGGGGWGGGGGGMGKESVYNVRVMYQIVKSI